jgi:hypothetical protein
MFQVGLHLATSGSQAGMTGGTADSWAILAEFRYPTESESQPEYCSLKLQSSAPSVPLLLVSEQDTVEFSLSEQYWS